MLLHQIRQPLDIALAQRVVIHVLHILQTRPTQQRTARRRRLEQAKRAKQFQRPSISKELRQLWTLGFPLTHPSPNHRKYPLG